MQGRLLTLSALAYVLDLCQMHAEVVAEIAVQVVDVFFQSSDLRCTRLCTKSRRAKVRRGKNRRGSGVYVL
ncbi:hypothetical protein CXB35_19485 [Pseudomonas syringae]|nr:hypothetical protein CXB35_19485 [Pseudomonas syringae]